MRPRGLEPPRTKWSTRPSTRSTRRGWVRQRPNRPLRAFLDASDASGGTTFVRLLSRTGLWDGDLDGNDCCAPRAVTVRRFSLPTGWLRPGLALARLIGWGSGIFATCTTCFTRLRTTIVAPCPPGHLPGSNHPGPWCRAGMARLSQRRRLIEALTARC